jgi:hypothetical protein
MCNCLKAKIGTVILRKPTFDLDVSDLKKLYSKMIPIQIEKKDNFTFIIGYSDLFETNTKNELKHYAFNFETQTFKKIDFGI